MTVPGLCKLAHIEIVTPDIDRSLWFFRDLLGLHETERDDERIYLRCFGELDHHSLTLREGPTGIDHVAFRTQRPEDVAAFQELIRRDGVDVKAASGGIERGHGDAVRFTVPELDACIELFYDVERPVAPDEVRSKLPTNSARFAGCAPRRLDHINLSTSLDSLGASEAWLRDKLGFKRREILRLPSGQVGGSWLSVTPQPHDIAITVDVQGRTGRLNHLAFTMEEYADITRLADVIAEYDIRVDLPPGRHGVSQGHFYYVRDPGSGHRVELYSGGYLIFDPDWEPVEWQPEEFSKYGLKWVGPNEWTRDHNPNAENTPATCEAESPDGVPAMEVR